MAQYAYVVARNTRDGIQEEIDKAHAEGGGLVFLPRGTYRLDGPLRLKANVHLTGVGERTVLEVDPQLGPAAVDVNLIELIGGDDPTPHDIEISKLALRGPGTSPVLTEQASSDFRKGCGVMATQTDLRTIVVRGCRIENMSGCGLLFHTQSDRHRMTGLRVEDSVFLQNRRAPDAVKASAYKDVYCYGVHFEHIRVANNVCVCTPQASGRYGNDSGIAFVGNGQGGSVRHVHLTGNRCSGHRRHGLVLSYGKMEADGVFASGNRCEDNGWAGIYLNTDVTFTQAGRVVITGNCCAHNGCGGVGEPGRPDATIRGGIVLNGSYHTVVSGNVCTDNGTPGPAFQEHGFAADAEAVHAAGIRIRGAEHVVDANLVKGNRGDGIVLWPGGVSRLSIIGNRAVQNGRNGILVAGASDDVAEQVVVAGNVCAGNGESGVRSFLTDGVLIASNRISDNGGAGIELARTTKHVKIEGNLIDARAGQETIKDEARKMW